VPEEPQAAVEMRQLVEVEQGQEHPVAEGVAWRVPALVADPPFAERRRAEALWAAYGEREE
jgi:hypothetical protein